MTEVWKEQPCDVLVSFMLLCGFRGSCPGHRCWKARVSALGLLGPAGHLGASLGGA